MRSFAFTAVLSLALAACGGDTDAGGDVSTQGNLADDAAVNDVLGAGEKRAGATVLPTDAAGFANAVAASDLYEIESSALAREKASSAELRSFAQRLEREHRASSDQLKQAAAGLTVSPALDPEQQAMIDELKAASGAEFDGKYLGQQRLAHQKTLMLLQNYAGAGDNDSLKAFAEKARPMVEQHADMLNYMRR